MIEKTFDYTYDDGYVIGFEEGLRKGYDSGWNDAWMDFEPRIAKMWVELQTLNARISYLEKHTGLEDE